MSARSRAHPWFAPTIPERIEREARDARVAELHLDLTQADPLSWQEVPAERLWGPSVFADPTADFLRAVEVLRRGSY